MSSVNVAQGPISVDSVLKHRFIQKLDRDIPRRVVSAAYMANLVVVAVLMLLLPVVYAGIIALVAYGTWLHATNDAWLVSLGGHGRGVLVMGVVFIAPIVAGLLLIAFMVKPLFAPRGGPMVEQSLNRKDEPLLFAFVDRLCDVLHAPRPAEIHIDMELNASASFAGFVRGLLGGKMVLTLGLPLVAGMKVDQLSAVLAHELGHFSQRSALRLSYLIRQTNVWFAQAVYVRDGWDEALDGAARDTHWAITLTVRLSQLMVWFSRRVLWVLMMLGHLFSATLSRRMEFDADRYAAATVGSELAGTTLADLAVLDVSMRATFAQLETGLSERTLPNNVPKVMANRLAEVTQDVRARILKEGQSAKTGWWDSHPSTADRVTAIKALKEPGFFSCEEHAGMLFTNFEMLGRLMTRAYYGQTLGHRVNDIKTVAVEDAEAGRSEEECKQRVVQAYFGGLVDEDRPTFMEHYDFSGLDDEALVAEFLKQRSALAASIAEGREAMANWEKASNAWRPLVAMSVLASAGVPVRDGKAKVELAEIRRRLTPVERDMAQARQNMDRVIRHGLRRMWLALWLAGERPGRSRDSMREDEQSPSLSAALVPDSHSTMMENFRILGLVDSEVAALRERIERLLILVGNVEGHERDEHYVSAVVSAAKKVSAALDELRRALGSALYAFETGPRPISLAKYLVSEPVAPGEIQGALQIGRSALGKYYRLYARLLRELADKAASAEGALGVDPLPLD
jgi:Zn-dependent protease with chaperone function